MKNIFKLITLALAVFSFQMVEAQSSADMIKDVTVVQLTQTPGVFETTTLALEPGKYIFEVTNKNVDKKLGFWLTPEGQAKKQIPNSGLSNLIKKGETSRTGVVELKAGTYQYSCPLNPTPHYSIRVESD